MLRITLLMTMLTLMACVSSGSPIQSAEPRVLVAPVSDLRDSGRRGIVADLRPLTMSGQVKSLGISLRLTDDFKPNRNLRALSGSPEGSAAAREVLARRPGAAVEAYARSLARATFCPAGPLTLAAPRMRYTSPEDIGRIMGANGGNLFGPNATVPDGLAGVSVPAIAMDPSISDQANVELRCDTPNPYRTAGVTPAASTDPAGDVLTAVALRSYASGRTFVSVDMAHGTQVEFLAADGTAIFWYPGNTRVNRGRWTTEPNRAATASGVICYAYDGASYNPVTRTGGGRNCVAGSQFQRKNRDALSGDPSGLSSGEVPFVLERKRAYSLAALRRG